MSGRERFRRDPDDSRTVAVAKIAAIFLGPLVVILGLLFGVRLAFGAIGDAVCADYNFLSNDLCDRWHYDPPTEQSFPRPAGWRVLSHDLSCGSGGCPARTYVLEPPKGGTEPIDSWNRALRFLGWDVSRGVNEGRRYFVARKHDLQMLIESAEEDRFLPKNLRKARYVNVSFSIRGESPIYK